MDGHADDTESMIQMVESADLQGKDCLTYISDLELHKLVGSSFFEIFIANKWNGRLK